MILTSRDMNNIFTKEVEKFTSRGYTFNCGTMAGSQGEIAKVDLLSPDKKQIIRIFMDEERDKDYNDLLTITTKLYSVKEECVKVDNICNHSTLWTDHGTVHSKLTYYNINRYGGGKAFTDAEGIKEIQKIQRQRSMRKDHSWSNCKTTNITSDATKKIILPFVQRQNRCKSYQLNDIIKIEKSYNPYQDKTTYSVWAKKHWFELK